MKTFLSLASKAYYRHTLENFETRLNTIDTKEKSKKYQEEITVLKMMIVLLQNLLNVK